MRCFEGCRRLYKTTFADGRSYLHNIACGGDGEGGEGDVVFFHFSTSYIPSNNNYTIRVAVTAMAAMAIA